MIKKSAELISDLKVANEEIESLKGEVNALTEIIAKVKKVKIVEDDRCEIKKDN